MSDSLKALSNSMKAAGLQKLRWYCGMCSKQCRDENGFKCHCLSEAHLRQMELLRDDPNRFIDNFSNQFQAAFLDILRRKGGRLVKANEIYQEQIADKQHVHMNSTKWDTLTAFAQYLGKNKLAEVDQDAKGAMWVKYIKPGQASGDSKGRPGKDMDTEEIIIQRQMAAERARQQAAQQQQQSQPAHAESPAPAANASSSSSPNPSADSSSSSLPPRPAADEPLKFQLKSSSLHPVVRPTVSLFAPAEPSQHASNAPSQGISMALKRKSSTLDELMRENEAEKARTRWLEQKRDESAVRLDGPVINRAVNNPNAALSSFIKAAGADATADEAPFIPADSWLYPGIVVKVTDSIVANGEFNHQKGHIEKILLTNEKKQSSTFPYGAHAHVPVPAPAPAAAIASRYSALVRLSGGVVREFPESALETVLPSLNQRVLIVAGPHRGTAATLMGIDTEEFVCTVRIEEGKDKGKMIKDMQFEDLAKIHDGRAAAH